MICLKRAVIIFLICGVILNTACGREYDREKQNDIEYTIVSEEEMPQEIRQLIQESEKESFRKTYADKDYLYIIVGYGAQAGPAMADEIPGITSKGTPFSSSPRASSPPLPNT